MQTTEAVKVIGDISLALVCEVGGLRTVIPRSLLLAGSEVSKPGDEGVVVVPRRFAFDLGLLVKHAVAMVLAAVAACGPPPAHAGALDEPGGVLYRRYCGACHGPAGKGDGPVAPALGERPTDLTQLARQNGGTFPFDRVVEAIDGTKSVRAHGVSEMPVWGDVFRAQSTWPVERHVDARGKIVLITEYLRSIQRR
jgi:mono/diheme cytochrome c family protein